MKRFISVLLAVAMLAAFLPAFAIAAEQSPFTDVNGGEYYAQAAAALNKIGVISGYEDGSFGADRSVTRAEMAAMICRLLSKGQAPTRCNFSDVSEDHWARGYIGTAAYEGIITGDGNGAFRPSDDVKYEEALKMVVCALGLDKNITVDPADWSAAYIKAAQDNGLTASLKGVKGNASTRGDIAVMINNGLKNFAAPTSSIASGTYRGTQKILLTSAVPGAVIYYTTDGSTPTTSSFKYNDHIDISFSGTIKAIAVVDGVIESPVSTFDYTILTYIDDVISRGGGGGGGSSTYTVRFNLNYDGARNPSSLSVRKGQYVDLPRDPVREGYEFTGWYTNKDCTRKFSADTKVQYSFTLYAGWEAADGTFKVSFDLNYKGAEGAPETQTVNAGEYVEFPESPEREGYMFVGWYTSKDCTEAYDFTQTVNASITLYAGWLNLEDTTDSDGDGLTDEMEKFSGTDPQKPDTDEDGLTDYFEVYYSNTLPTEKDSDRNDVMDCDEDPDNDGLTNLQEQENNSDPYLEDTDFDGLIDGEEIEIGTRLDSEDTDGDGLNDAEEIALGLDPLKEMTDGVTLDSLRTFEQTLSDNSIDEELTSDENELVPSVSGDVSGLIDSKVKLIKSEETALENISAVVGSSVDIAIDEEEGENTSLTLSFDAERFVDNKGEEKAESLIICKLDDYEWVPLETAYNESSHEISADIDSAGMYFVADPEELLLSMGIDVLAEAETASLMNIYEENWEEYAAQAAELQAETTVNRDLLEADEAEALQDGADAEASNDNGGDVVLLDSPLAEAYELEEDDPTEDDPIVGTTGDADVMFVVDTTGSMAGSIYDAINNINSFVTQMSESYDTVIRFGLVTYKDIEEDGNGTTQFHGWTTNANSFKSSVSSLVVDGGGDEPESALDALGCAINSGFRSNAVKFIILITDAGYKVSNNYGIGSIEDIAEMLKNDEIVTCVAAYSSSYSPLCDATGGILLSLGSGFSSILSLVGEKIGDIVNSGYWARLSTYENVRLDNESDDTDGDGISDVEELGELIEKDLTPYIYKVLASNGFPISMYSGKTKIPLYKYISHPLKIDSDGDGFADGVGGVNTPKSEYKKDEHPLKWDISDRNLAMCADTVYKNLPVGTKLENNADSAELKGWKVVNTHYNDITGMQAAAYMKDDNIVVSFRGSESDDIVDILQDWVYADILGYISGSNAQAPLAKSYMMSVIKKYPTYNIYISGHSLGGNLAYNAAAKALSSGGNIERVRVFNGLGLLMGVKSDLIILNLPDCVRDSIILELNSSKIANYRVKGDVISILPLALHFGERRTSALSSSVGSGPVAAHSLDSFFTELLTENNPDGE